MPFVYLYSLETPTGAVPGTNLGYGDGGCGARLRRAREALARS
jgi:hypothetical protein